MTVTALNNVTKDLLNVLLGISNDTSYLRYNKLSFFLEKKLVVIDLSILP